MNKKILLSVVGLIVAGVFILGMATTQVQAFQYDNSTIIQKLAQKFGLKESEVQAVFDQERKERHDQRQQMFEEKLDQAVLDDKISETQKQLILKKHGELHEQREANMQNWQNLTPQERHDKMQAQRGELNQWAKDNNIDPLYLFGGSGMRGMHQMKGDGLGFDK